VLRALSAAYALTMAAALLWWTAASTPSLTSDYDWSNRVLVIPLALLTAFFVTAHRTVRLRAAMVAAVAAGLMTGGIVVEFWFGMLQSAPLSGDAKRRGLPESSVWIGSDIGFYVYGLGLLMLTVTSIVVGIQLLRRARFGSPAAIAVLAVGPLQMAGFVTKDISVGASAIVAALMVASGLVIVAARVADTGTAVATPVAA
jgi:hypothetical protein